MTAKARYIMIGGFLGAGKTTAVGNLAKLLTDRGLRVGLITNDQGRNLVDTAMLRSRGFRRRRFSRFRAATARTWTNGLRALQAWSRSRGQRWRWITRCMRRAKRCWAG